MPSNHRLPERKLAQLQETGGDLPVTTLHRIDDQTRTRRVAVDGGQPRRVYYATLRQPCSAWRPTAAAAATAAFTAAAMSFLRDLPSYSADAFSEAALPADAPPVVRQEVRQWVGQWSTCGRRWVGSWCCVVWVGCDGVCVVWVVWGA